VPFLQHALAAIKRGWRNRIPKLAVLAYHVGSDRRGSNANEVYLRRRRSPLYIDLVATYPRPGGRAERTSAGRCASVRRKRRFARPETPFRNRRREAVSPVSRARHRGLASGKKNLMVIPGGDFSIAF
jgi:hypothetical protein